MVDRDTQLYFAQCRDLIKLYAPKSVHEVRSLSSIGTALIACIYLLDNSAFYVRANANEADRLLSLTEVGESLSSFPNLHAAAVEAVHDEANAIFRQLQMILNVTTLDNN